MKAIYSVPLRSSRAARGAMVWAACLSLLVFPAFGTAGPADERAAKVRQLLATPVDIPLEKSAWPMPAADFIGLVKKQVPALHVMVGERPEWASAATVWPPRLNRPEAFCGELHQVPLSEVLNLCVPPMTTWEVLPDGLLIRGTGSPASELSEVRYPVGPMLAAAAAVRPPKKPEPSPATAPDAESSTSYGMITGVFGPRYRPFAFDGGAVESETPRPLMGVAELEAMLKSLGGPHGLDAAARWSGDGGTAEMKYLGDPQSPGPKDVLSIRQTAEGHRRIAAAMEALCRSFGVEYAGPAVVPAPSMDAAVARTRRLLDAKIDVDFHDAALSEVLAFLCKAAPGLELVADDRAAEKIRDAPGVTMRAKGLAAGAVLDLCSRGRFQVDVRPGYVRLQSVPDPFSETPLVVYPVGKLLAAVSRPPDAPPVPVVGRHLFASPFARPSEGSGNDAEVVKFIWYSVNAANDCRVAPWIEEGGRATIQCVSDRLIVVQTAEGQSQITRLLATMCRSFGVEYGGPGAPPAEAPDAALERTHRLLEEKIDVDFRGVTWPEFLAGLQKAGPGLCFVRGPCQVPESRGREHKFWIQGKGLSVRTVLDLVARDCHCAYEVGPGWVALGLEAGSPRDMTLVDYPLLKIIDVLTPPEPCQKEMGPDYYGMFAVPYRSSSPAEDFAGLIDIVKQTVNASSDATAAEWSDAAGPATANYLGGRLWVRQTREAQDRIARLLDQIAGGYGLELPVPVPPKFAADQAARDRVRELLARKVSVDFQGTRLADAADYLRRSAPGLNIVLPSRCYEEGGDEGRLWLVAKDTPLERVLGLMGDQHASWEIRPDCLCLGQPDPMLPVKVYPVGGLLHAAREADRSYPELWKTQQTIFTAPGSPYNGAEMGYVELINMIKQSVNSTSDPAVVQWSDEGGPAVTRYMPGLLIISQTDAGHRKIDDMLAVCRAAFERTGQLPLHPRAPVRGFIGPTDTAALRMAELLQTRIDVDFQDAPAGDVLATIAARVPGLRFVLSNSARQGLVTAGWPAKRLTLKAQGVTCADLLKRIMGEALRCRIGPEAVVLDSKDPGSESIEPPLVLVMYPVRDLMNTGGTSPVNPGDPRMGSTTLIGIIKQSVNMAADRAVAQWSDDGGPAAFSYISGVLYITQTPTAHAAIKDLLDDLRREARGRGPVP